MRLLGGRQPKEPVRETNHVKRLPDGDRVLADGVPHWSELLGEPAGAGSQANRSTQRGDHR